MGGVERPRQNSFLVASCFPPTHSTFVAAFNGVENKYLFYCQLQSDLASHGHGFFFYIAISEGAAGVASPTTVPGLCWGFFSNNPLGKGMGPFLLLTVIPPE